MGVWQPPTGPRTKSMLNGRTYHRAKASMWGSERMAVPRPTLRIEFRRFWSGFYGAHHPQFRTA